MIPFHIISHSLWTWHNNQHICVQCSSKKLISKCTSLCTVVQYTTVRNELIWKILNTNNVFQNLYLKIIMYFIDILLIFLSLLYSLLLSVLNQKRGGSSKHGMATRGRKKRRRQVYLYVQCMIWVFLLSQLVFPHFLWWHFPMLYFKKGIDRGLGLVFCFR